MPDSETTGRDLPTSSNEASGKPQIKAELPGVNRGKRAPREGSGDVIGSGAAAGGTGGGDGVSEDYDDDSVGGGSRTPTGVGDA